MRLRRNIRKKIDKVYPLHDKVLIMYSANPAFLSVATTIQVFPDGDGNDNFPFLQYMFKCLYFKACFWFQPNHLNLNTFLEMVFTEIHPDSQTFKP